MQDLPPLLPADEFPPLPNGQPAPRAAVSEEYAERYIREHRAKVAAMVARVTDVRALWAVGAVVGYQDGEPWPPET